MTAALRRWWGGRPLRQRITLVVGGVALVALLALSRLGAGLVYQSLLAATDEALRARAETAVVEIAAAGSTGDPAVRVVDLVGTAVDGGSPLPLAPGQVRSLAAGEPVLSGLPAAPRRWLAAPTRTADGSSRLVVVSADLVGAAELLHRASTGFLVGALLVAAVVALAAWTATRAALGPVGRMRTAAAAVVAGERLPVPPAADELRALAEEINLLLARRDDAVARMERFTGDAAHELRSPVAAIRAQAEVALAHPDPERVGETLTAVATAARRLSELLSALLALARADAGHRLPAGPVDLPAAARAALDRCGPHGPALRLEAPIGLTVAASPAEVALVLDNLVDNARRHARSWVEVAVLPAGRQVRLVVDDDGPGIPPPDRERVFDRFTRLQPEAGGGSGLGLALVAALVAGRGGTVSAGEGPGGGARVEVRWPA